MFHLKVGLICGISFWLLFVVLVLFVMRPDAQSGIGLMLSPFYAILVGVFAGAISASIPTRR